MSPLALTFVLGFVAPSSTSLDTVDALAAHPPDREVRVPSARVVHVERRLGVPTFVRAPRDARPVVASGPAEAAASYLRERAAWYGLSEELDGVEVMNVHDIGFGVIIVRHGMRIRGVPVFRAQLNVALDRELGLRAITGYLAPDAQDTAKGRTFELTAQDALALAAVQLHGVPISASAMEIREIDTHGYHHLAAPWEGRARQVWFILPDSLEPSWYVELFTDEYDFSFVFGAERGELLYRHDLVDHDVHDYRLWADTTAPFIPHDGPQGTSASPHPTGLPDGFQAPFVAPVLVSLDFGPISTGDPWLDVGATETVGNNVDAYVDIASPDGLTSGDFRASLVSPFSFDRTYDALSNPDASGEQQMAVVANLFYLNNFLHDWFYDVGFDESSGNAQENNLLRGGIGQDRLKAEAQDYRSRNNANMRTPADGGRPRMQMYIWDSRAFKELTVNSPASIAGVYVANSASFGPQSYDLTADLVAADDGTATLTDACEPLVNGAQVAGNIVIVVRGNCLYVEKANNVQDAGGVGMLLANNQGGNTAPSMGGTDPGITIPSLLVSQQDGLTIFAELGNGINLRMYRELEVDRSSSLDNTIVAHEWGHFISNRLVGDGAGLSSTQGGGLGEGFSDFHSLLLMVREEDRTAPAGPDFTGVYAGASYVSSGGGNQGYYWGIRRYPYSIDFAKNPLTFEHIDDTVALPTTAPFDPTSSPNSQVHNAGEIWGTMLWECYAALLRDETRLTFQQAQDRMRAYLVGGYKLTPVSPTFVEARDALLEAVFVGDPADHALCLDAFARRGMGVGAIAPDRFAPGNVGVVESYTVGNDVRLVSVKIQEAFGLWCDEDGAIDEGETGEIVVTLKNTGAGVLNATTATVTSTVPEVIFGNGGVLVFPSLQPFEERTASVTIQLLGFPPGPSVVPMTLSWDDPSLPASPARTLALAARMDYDEQPASGDADDVEALIHPWGVSRGPAASAFNPWSRTPDSFANHRWQVNGSSLDSDERLTSPPLDVSTVDPLVITFQHAYSFEARSGPEYYDGGVIELSSDAGNSWTDIGALATPGYGGPLETGSDNVLEGRDAWVGTSPAYPGYHLQTVDLGAAYAGQTVQFRLRMSADDGTGSAPWRVDDILVTGITNTPFTTLVPEDGVCQNRPPIVDAGPDLVVNEGAVVALVASATDFDSDPLTLLWTQVGGAGMTLTGSDTDRITFTAPYLPTGAPDERLEFRFEATDGAQTTSDLVMVTVTNLNQPPVADAGIDTDVVEETIVTLTGAAVDADADPVTFAWTQSFGVSVTLNGESTANPSFTAPTLEIVTSPSPLEFTLVVNDGLVDSAPDTVVVTVLNLNGFSPTASAPADQIVAPGDTVRLVGRGADGDGDPLFYEWLQTAGPTVTLTDSRTDTASFVAPDVTADTDLTFWLLVSDGERGSAPAEARVTVALFVDGGTDPDAGVGFDAGVPDGGSGSDGGPPTGERGCGCESNSGSPELGLLALLLLAAMRPRRPHRP